ncbi:MAG TPA: SDR family NAD(P)-dependent oxidoreductase [Candidatus Nanoarchaeia archaeon]|nr:SDR family NAD(P)-dependent oxidoreductase [Candidatus Nanoarchaeia archaeon]
MGLFTSGKLKGKVAIVTGGTKGIGLAIANKLKSEGATVVVCARSPGKKEKHTCVPADVSKMSDVQALVEFTIKKYKKIDILVNNAGIFPAVSFKDMTEQQWDQMMTVNLKGVFNCTKAVLPSMMARKYGKIINLSSIAGQLGFPGLSHYCTTKAGVSGLTRALALELAEHNIRVNAIAPGLISTPGVDDFMNSQEQAAFVSSIPIKRIGKPEDIAELAAFLASDASDNITGQTIVSDGGTVLQ